MNQVAAFLASQNGLIRSNTSVTDLTPQRSSATANALAGCWQALRHGLRLLWRTQPRNAETAQRVSRPVSPRSWRGRHYPPMLSFATGAHALVPYPLSHIDDRRRLPEPDQQYGA
jgi:hypothetical protein